MSAAIRAACAKLITVETAAGVLMRLPEATHLLPSLLYLREETEQAMIYLVKTTKQPVKESHKVDDIIQHVKRMQDDIHIDESCTEPEPHSDVYLAAACTLILEDLVETYTDQKKIDIIEPLRQCADNIESDLDKGCVLYDTRKEADLFVSRVYRKINEVNH